MQLLEAIRFQASRPCIAACTSARTVLTAGDNEGVFQWPCAANAFIKGHRQDSHPKQQHLTSGGQQETDIPPEASQCS